jgi:hypothetical protein
MEGEKGSLARRIGGHERKQGRRKHYKMRERKDKKLINPRINEDKGRRREDPWMKFQEKGEHMEGRTGVS